MPKVWIYVARIGILVLTNKPKDRLTQNNYYFDSMKNAGIRHVSVLAQVLGHSVEHCSLANMNDYDFVFYSVLSAYEYVNLLSFKNVLKNRKTKIVLGGAGLINVAPLLGIADIFRLGRCDTPEDLDEILGYGDTHSCVYADKDMGLEGKYEIAMPKKLVSIKGYNETAVGCNAKCFFCQYAWKNGTLNAGKANYESGYNQFEDYLTSIQWEKIGGKAVSAIDGLTEKTRLTVNKRITNQEIVDSIKRGLNSEKEKRSLKLFNIVGYPWEDKSVATCDELRKCFDVAAQEAQGMAKMSIIISNNHFAPMPLTPLELLPFNSTDFRAVLLNNTNKCVVDNERVNAWHYSYSAGPISSMEQTIINRANQDSEAIKLFSNPKYHKLSAPEKMSNLMARGKQELSEQDEQPLKYITRNYRYTPMTLLDAKKKVAQNG